MYSQLHMTQTIEVEGYHGSTELSLPARFLKQGQVFLLGEINAESANMAMMQLMYLEKQDGNHPVRIYINSPGGEVTAGLMIYDVLQAMKKPVDIYCTALAASMAAVILAGGKKGHRFIFPHAKTMIHEPLILSGVGGSATSIHNISESILQTKQMLNELLAKHTGKSIDLVNEATSYDHYMTADESVAFGLCDEVRMNIF